MSQVITDYTYEADELELFIENDELLYHSQFIPICKNVQRRMAKGTYDSAKAVKLFMYLVDRGARMYCAEHGGTVRSMFPKECPRLRDYMAELGAVAVPGFVTLSNATDAFDETGILRAEKAQTSIDALARRLISACQADMTIS